MILLDTDHVTVLAFPRHSRHGAMRERMATSSDPRFALPLIAVEEQMRGWLGAIHRQKDIRKQVPAYSRLAELVEFWGRCEIIAFDEAMADTFARLRKEPVRIGTQDLKIAALALVMDALLLTANRRDFERVPGLRFENWLE
jgi:tRNA(fMet)-specific endonuclease VapC